jgi:hypothetical protein
MNRSLKLSFTIRFRLTLHIEISIVMDRAAAIDKYMFNIVEQLCLVV